VRNSPEKVAASQLAFRDRVTSLFAANLPEQRATVAELITLAEGSVSHQSNIVGHSELESAVCIMQILADIRADYPTLLSALLYALLLVNALEWERIESDFDDEIQLLVRNIERLHLLQASQLQNTDSSEDQQEIEGLRRLLLALAADVRVVMVQLAERLYLLRNIKQLAASVRHQIAEECMAIYAPLANRLGIWQFKWELEDLSFRYLEPETYRTIAKMLDEKRVDREHYIENVLQQLRDEIKKQGIIADVSGRPKHIYSIWRKMKKKGLGFHELFDVRAARVLVDKVSDCYMVLGIVHTLWRPVKSEFDDYIASPKANNYQSLHTAVIGPEDKTLEVQIRTYEMHEHCEFGFASHWSYKEGGRSDQKIQQQINSLRRLLELREESAGSADGADDAEDGLLDQIRNELLEERVYVLTPKNKVIDLPSGATTLDFAYAIHSEVGHHYRGAKVNGVIVPQGYRLSNGQQVEVLTAPQAHPSRDWLNPSLGYAQSSRTRAKIRAWFRQQDFSQNRNAGQQILEQELKRLSVKEVDVEKLLKRFNQTSEDDFFAALGRGDISMNKLASALSGYVLPKKGAEFIPRRSSETKSDLAGTSVQVMGVGDLLVTMAKCCKPVPNDRIVGYITRGRGVTVHRADCSNLLQMELDREERFIEVNWGRRGDQTYPVEIAVRAFDRQGLLQDITTILSNEHLNVTDVNTHTDKKTCIANMSLSVEVSDAMQLSRALTRIEHLSNVLEVSRK